MDVYDEVPTIVTIWLTIVPKIALLVLILEIYTQLNIYSSIENVLISLQGIISNNLSVIGTNPIYSYANNNDILAIDQLSLKNIFLISSVLSLIIGTVVGLAQNKIKRLLA